MFESDDLDRVFSQLDYSDPAAQISLNKNYHTRDPHESIVAETQLIQPLASHEKHLKSSENFRTSTKQLQNIHTNDIHTCGDIENHCYEHGKRDGREMGDLAKASKRKMLKSLFDNRSKRKFPGPAGMLTGIRAHDHPSHMSTVEIFSQDVDCSQERLHPEVFESDLWQQMQRDLQDWGGLRIDSISCLMQPAPVGRRASRKAHTIVAFVETIDRSGQDPMIILRDRSGTIKCTLHRDAWSAFAPYIISEYTAMAIWKPTVLTTGITFKKHYLNITLSNIIAIYGSKCIINLREDKHDMPSGYTRISVDDLTIIKMNSCPQHEHDATNSTIHLQEDTSHTANNQDHLEGLDSLSFLDDIF